VPAAVGAKVITLSIAMVLFHGNPPSRMEGQVKAPPTLVVRSNSPVICAHEGIRNRSGKQDQSGVAVRFKEP
jgi:hypothetical protein